MLALKRAPIERASVPHAGNVAELSQSPDRSIYTSDKLLNSLINAVRVRVVLKAKIECLEYATIPRGKLIRFGKYKAELGRYGQLRGLE
jgi:hypothetical protein